MLLCQFYHFEKQIRKKLQRNLKKLKTITLIYDLHQLWRPASLLRTNLSSFDSNSSQPAD